MSRLSRHFLLVSLPVLTVAAISLSMLYWYDQSEEHGKLIEAENVRDARLLSNILKERFPDFFQPLTESVAPDRRAVIQEVDSLMRDLAAGATGLLKVKLYSTQGLTLYSSSASEIGNSKSDNPTFLKAARNGLPVSGLSFRKTFDSFDGILTHRYVVETYSPVRDAKGDLIGIVENYHDATNSMERMHRHTLWAALLIAAVLAAALAGLMMNFFRRMGKDIQRVHHRAVEIVGGYRGEPLPVTRQDELGSLMEAVNHMQHGLREQELQLEHARQQQFHKEKMAAAGSLAAAVAHEINNPLSAIIGIATMIAEHNREHNCQMNGAPCQPELILDPAHRIMSITRQICEFSVPRSPNPEFFDLNGLLRSTCKFVSFDHRFLLLELDLDLDNELPAVFGVADHLMQVVMNLLINAGDVLQGQHDPAPKIRVISFAQDDRAVFEVSDNGAGIPPENLDQVFTEYFTTKAPGTGIGLGLSLCRRLIQDAEGSISIASTAGAGTTVTVILPTRPQPPKVIL